MRTISANTTGSAAAFTLAETMISIAILGMVFASSIVAYTRACERAEWAGYNLSAQALTIRQLERFRAVVWDTQVIPMKDDTTNIPMTVVAPLDLPFRGTNAIWATNFTSVTTFTNSGPSYFKMIQVDTVWLWKNRLFTNTVVSYRTPDQ